MTWTREELANLPDDGAEWDMFLAERYARARKRAEDCGDQYAIGVWDAALRGISNTTITRRPLPR